MIAVSGFDAGRSDVFVDGVDACSGTETVGKAASGVEVGIGVEVGVEVEAEGGAAD